MAEGQEPPAEEAANAAAPAGEEKKEDGRIAWFEKRISAGIKTKPAVAAKFLQGDEFVKAVERFCESSHVLVVQEKQNGDLTASNSHVAVVKKALVFYKVHDDHITEDNIKSIVCCQEVGPNCVDLMLNATRDVYSPVLGRNGTQLGLSEIVAQELQESLNRLISGSQVVVGKMMGKTILPLPPDDTFAHLEKAAHNKDSIHALESAVITWTGQIKAILNSESETPLLKGENPGPDAELNFWSRKAENLTMVRRQLTGTKIAKVTKVLEKARSSYYPAFARLVAEVRQAGEQANDAARHLKALEGVIQQLKHDDFGSLVHVFKPMLLILLLIWKHSTCYSTPHRMVVLLREVCNDVIARAQAFLEEKELFALEPQDAADALKHALRMCITFKSVFFAYQRRAMSECPSRPWHFEDSSLFARLDAFLERVHDVLDLMQTIMQFSKLARIEIGGTKGKALSSNLSGIYADFVAAVEPFKSAAYNIISVEEPQFEDDFFAFRLTVQDLERRLASVIIQAFDDSTTIMARFKLLDSFENLLERDVISSDLEKKHTDLLETYAVDLRMVQDLFIKNQADPPVNENCPPRAGAIMWARGLIQRLDEPMSKFQSMGKTVTESEEGVEATRAYEAIVASMAEFEARIYSEWTEEMEHTSQDKLKQNLLLREDTGENSGMLRVNFDPALVCLLREVKYFKLLNDCKAESQSLIPIPESAMEIFSKAETFRQQTGNLELIVNIYNNMLATLVDVERPLLQGKMDSIDKVLIKGLKHFNWKSTTIAQFISDTMAMVKEANSILQTCKSNVRETQSLLTVFSTQLMMERKAARSYTIEEYQELSRGVLDARYKAIQSAGVEMQKHLESSLKVLKVKNSNEAWRTYVDYVNQIVIDGLVTSIMASMRFLKNQIDAHYLNTNDVNPLLEISLRLAPPDVVYEPMMGATASGDGMRDIINGWTNGFINSATLVGRLDTLDYDGDYLADIQEDVRVRFAVAQVSRLTADTERACEEFRQCFLDYAYLWTTSIEDEFQAFLDSEVDRSEGAIDNDPPLAAFDERIARYKALQDEVTLLPVQKTIAFLKIDAKPVKTSLFTYLSKWVHRFQDYLLHKVTTAVIELSEFISFTEKALDTDVTDLDSLLQVMGYLRDVRKRTDSTESMFEPLRNIVSLLNRRDVSTPSEIVQGLEQLPMTWASVKKKTTLTKEKHSKEQSAQAEKVKRDSKEFEFRAEEFFAYFKKTMPYEYASDIEEAYAVMDRIHHAPRSDANPVGSLVDIKRDAQRLNEMQELFELFVIEYRQIDQCDKEAKFLKEVWDMIAHVNMCYSEWRKAKWNDIKVDDLLDTNKQLAKEIKTCDKYVKNWHAYKGLEDAVKNMGTSLPLVGALHHPAMRERHWQQLMRTAGQPSGKVDSSFTLGRILDMELHRFEDDVLEIVDRAQKELTIEKQLKKLSDTWRGQELGFPSPPDQPEMHLLSVDETLTEALEDNSMQLQNLMGSKYVQGNASFLEIVQDWQRKLGMVDVTLTAWREVQSKWSNLQSIFVGSADIRVQLPEESKRFDSVDADFKEMMKDAPSIPNAVEACNLEGRLERIENMLALLEQCEKALADYLETKRAAYPRFYFVAAADLLDILSKGSNPQLILKHLPKCFDNIKTLEFEKDPRGEPTRQAIGMYSGENEFVGWTRPFTCEGAVEVWLDGLTHHTHEELKALLLNSVTAFEEKPRDQFIFDWCAELAQVVCRIVYTEDVVFAFDQLEEGNDRALTQYNAKQVELLNRYAELILGELTSNDRRKIIMLVTLDVHARDVVQGLIDSKAESAQNFAWMSQLKFSMDDKANLCKIEICDYSCFFGYEYIGNCGCLVVTPLTDRCYITLTQAMRLILGGAPAGPAGTGKTETTKDLGRALGVMVYVFNCSDQMDYKSMGQIFKGLSQAGAWGCFDEFNRIDISVLSVVSTQWKCILDAIRARKTHFIFEDEDIHLCHSPFCSSYITMNPGYAGRTELPESVKALFRPCAMIVPDMDLICEIMLMSEGYSNGKVLARKFMILYRLSEALLSAQKHYDWKLRAVKTTLNVAGGMKRADRTSTEDKVLLRALRDFNLGKLVADDVNIFVGMIDDLFPKLREEVVRARELEFEAAIKEAARSANLQAEEMFVLKASQLREILIVRWSVFLIGPAGCGKSELIKTLSKAENIFGEKSTINVLNPKSVTRNELYGYIHPSTREWKDGLLSQIFRDLANTQNVKHEYLVLDGDIDAEWIESMNTVMDDNKTLTLASNERIPLTPPMRLLLEIENMSQASPATVSRGGVIFMNSTDVGWQPYVKSWIQNREVDHERVLLTSLFEKYAGKSMEWVSRNVRTIVPIPEISMVQSLTHIIEGMVGNGEELLHLVKTTGQEAGNKMMEMIFMYATIWSTAGAIISDKQNDFRGAFDKWFRTEFAEPVQLPEEGTVFDFWVDKEQIAFANWAKRTASYSHDPAQVFGNIFVATMETERVTFLLDLMIRNRHACMLVGGAGTGKTTIMKAKLRSMDPDAYANMSINLNCFTDSMLLQSGMESVLEKKTGRTFGPTGSKRLVYFIDDLNMPEVDKYGTQQPIALLRQLFDYSGWYSRDKLTWREIVSVQIVSCLNPTAGSFFIDKRLQRSYFTLAVQLPSHENLELIFDSILSNHLATFSADVSKVSNKLVKASIDIQKTVADNFLATAIKFHYVFNLRDIGNVFEGLLRARPEHFATPLLVYRLWVHECERVFSDRMVSEADLTRFSEILEATAKRWFEGEGQDKILARPNIFTTFTHPEASEDNRPYVQAGDAASLRGIVEDKLREYNEANAVMDLVLFEMAIEHVCRTCRTIDRPRGNALLVGVGGSGKQSLARLSSFICGMDPYQITVTSSYGVNDFKEDLLSLFQRAAVKGQPMSFILVDSQIVNERFLVFLNDFLASGNIPDLFTNDLKDEFRNAVRNEAKQAGLQDTPENLWDFFIEKSRSNLHLILCFSPVGDQFRVRARQFPALINATVFDYFHPWPQEALLAVAAWFVNGTEGILPENYEDVAAHMAFLHTSVGAASEEFRASERRYNYTTPKSFLDLIDLYKSMLATKRKEMGVLKERLENGLEKMQSAAEQVAELQENLVKDMALVEQKKEATDKLLEFVGQETAGADEQKAKALIEEEKCTKIAEEVSVFQAECEKDMAAAEPVIQAAIEALNSLDKKSITELKALASPPAGVDDVTAGVMVLMGGGKIPKDVSWGASKKLMGNVDQFLTQLINFDKDNTPVVACEWIEKNLLKKEAFNPAAMKSKSAAAAGMCGWVINIVAYYRIYEVVEPKRQLLLAANTKLEDANTQLAEVRDHVAQLEARLAELSQQFEEATAEKNEAIAQAEKTQTRANMADRLVNGLADEKVRWTRAVESFGLQESQFVGDVMLASAFVSYVGAFNLTMRHSLVSDKWIPDLVERKIPMTQGMQPLTMLVDDAGIAQWATQGLPSDTMSIQNGAIVCNCKRWPILIDPQLQGITWIKGKHLKEVFAERPADLDPEEEWTAPSPTIKEMVVIQMTQPRYLNHVEIAISNGDAIMIENLGEEIDAVLGPVLERAVTRRGRSMVIKVGDKEVEYDPAFKLYLQTKLSNPHYMPQVCAQTTLINFMITIDGLQEQLLALVVRKERPDLEEQKMSLIEQQNGFKLKLKELEDELLYRLASSQGDILADVELIEGLERAKVTASDINEKAKVALETEVAIATSRKVYVPVAARGALTYFLVDQMWCLDHMYRFSMSNFVASFCKGMDVADVVLTEAEKAAEKKDGRKPDPEQGELTELDQRVARLVDAACFECFSYVSQGLFERHKLIFVCQLCFRVLAHAGVLQAEFFDFLLRAPVETGQDNPLSEWMDDRSWATVQSLRQFELFERLPDELVGSAKRFREWYELDRPEEAPLPGDWRKLSAFQTLLVIRALRPDRMTEALTIFARDMMGRKYVTSRAFALEMSFEDASSITPVFFILSPGVNPVRDTERLAKKYKVGAELGNFGLVSLGQGQEPVAEKIVMEGYLGGSWAFLQNIHLTPKWTNGWLDKRCDDLSSAHPDFRLFLSAEPAKLPVNLLQVCVKLTNEPPEGLKPNLLKNVALFSDDFFDASAKPSELKSIVFGLSLFHAVILERKKFGPQGWNRNYPFNIGDLSSCAQVAMNYLEVNPKVPWDDLKYIFGEIMYGGHITDHYDRILAAAYLDAYMKDDLLEGAEMYPGFPSIPNGVSAKEILETIESTMPQESPVAFGLHPNAEIGFRMKQAETIFLNIRELQPRSGAGAGGLSALDKAKEVLDEITEKMPERLDVAEVMERVEDRTPYVNVFLQELERLGVLQAEMAASLAELDLGLRGDLQMSERMEALQAALAEDRVPGTWAAKAYPSMRPLALWFTNLLDRHRQLSDWTVDLSLPKVTWLSGLFNPQSFLTAVTQATARKHDWPLDRMVTVTEVPRLGSEVVAPAKDGAYITGLFIEGARWDDKAGQLEDSRHKELFAKMPIVTVRAVPVEKADARDTYTCPVYQTKDRGPTFVFNAVLRTREPPAKWVMAGVAMLMDIL